MLTLCSLRYGLLLGMCAVSVVAGIVMLILFLSEFRAYMSLNTHEHMVVDSSLNEKLQINLDISFLAINCKGALVRSHVYRFFLNRDALLTHVCWLQTRTSTRWTWRGISR